MAIRSALHLTHRFFGALRPGDAGDEETVWALSMLLPGEQVLWRQMSGADQRHSAGVARRVERALGAEASRPVLAAALLHDVGKIEADLGTWGRVAATLVGLVVGRDRARTWVDRPGTLRRLGLYHAHAGGGADLLAVAGSDLLTIAWAREHHLPPGHWTIDPVVAHALKDADDD
ncbi:MAG: hypothetical protein HYZ59_02575 [Actinobacteria bacterium]|nr:hypothetical protein [Actinomycetota bacterium]